MVEHINTTYGRQIQLDIGIDWVDLNASDIASPVLEEINEIIENSDSPHCLGYTASNGATYRWAYETDPFYYDVHAVVEHCNKVISPELSSDFYKITFHAVWLSDKWIRIERRYGREQLGSAYCFIARQSFVTKTLGQVLKGGIYKPASFKAAAKHARGYVYDKLSWNCLGTYGVAYLRG